MSKAARIIERHLLGKGPSLRGADETFQNHVNWLRRLLGRRLRIQPTDIDDLVQDTYLRVVSQPEGSVRHPRAFLAQTALNLFRDGRRREAVRAGYRSRAGGQSDAPDGGAARMTEQEAALLLDQIVGAMPVLYRDVFALSRFRHMTNQQIADHLGLSIKTVEWRMGKALEYCADGLRG